MKRVLLVIAGVAAALGAPSAAAAKNISEVKLCGPSACATITDHNTLQRWMEANGGAPAATPPLSAYYRLEITVTAGPGEKFDNGKTAESWSQWYVPAAHAVRGTDETGGAAWTRQSGRAEAIFTSATRNVDPYPRPTITAATVGRRAVNDPASYARLFNPSWKLATSWSASDWRKIRLHSASPSPWTDGKNVLSYSPKKRVLARDGTLVQVPRSVAARLTRARSLQAGSGHGRLAFAAAGAVAAGLALAVRRSRRTT